MKKKEIIEEFIGKRIKVIKSTSKELTGKEGKVIDETMKTFIIEEKKGEKKTIPKKEAVFMINGKKIPGNELVYRPVERIKKNWRKIKWIKKIQKLA